MIHIERDGEPEFWQAFRKKNPGIRYDDLENSEEGKQIRQKLRQFNVAGQHGLCAYCCASITSEQSINEHIKPKGVGAYASFSMEYANIVACCISKGKEPTCGTHKGNRYDHGLFVSPLDRDCESHFEYFSSGEVVSDSKRGQYTIDLLNLNSYKLQKARAAQLKACRNFHSSELIRQIYLKPETENRLRPYIDIVKFFCSRNEL